MLVLHACIAISLRVLSSRYLYAEYDIYDNFPLVFGAIVLLITGRGHHSRIHGQ